MLSLVYCPWYLSLAIFLTPATPVSLTNHTVKHIVGVYAVPSFFAYLDALMMYLLHDFGLPYPSEHTAFSLFLSRSPLAMF